MVGAVRARGGLRVASPVMVDRSRRRPRLVAAAGAVLLLLLGLLAVPAGAQEAVPPSTWPASPNASPRLEGLTHALRVAGADRYSTSLALALTLRGAGGYPFSTPDRSSGGVSGLSDGDGWWGVGACPRAVIVVAGDSPADALAASALSDPTGQSTEPFLQRTAAADPLFDPPGGFARVDTDSAPILVTRSAREGATQLSVATRIAAQDLSSGGCTTARQAIVVGGTSAVPAGVDDELVSIGYSEVFRVSGATRYETAADVARSLGTAPVPGGVSGCADPTTDDGTARMAFHANSVVELRDSASECRVLGRTVVLADGLTGADALAAGWWTSFWQVPVLLHDGSAALPTATVEALETMEVEHVVLLGGTARLPQSVADEVAALTGAETIRISGADRYATSVAMAQRFGGWWPTGDGADFEGSMVCLAASAGEGRAARGWPDALGAGPWCGAASGAASNPGAPARALAPTSGSHPHVTFAGIRPAHDAVPVLLVPVVATSLPTSVRDLLSGAFGAETTTWCSSSVAGPCTEPGFVVAFGGASVVGDEALLAASRLVSGHPALDEPTPRRDPMFHTELDLTPVFGTQGAGSQMVCAERNGYAGVRWLAVFRDAAASRLHAAGDVLTGGRYVSDADSVARSPGVGAPTCVAFTPTGDGTVTLRGVSPSGRVTPVGQVSFAPANRFSLDGPITGSGPQSSSGIDADIEGPQGGVTVRTYVSDDPEVQATSRTVSMPVSSAAITITLTRGPAGGPHTFTAAWSLVTHAGTVTGTARGVAILAAGQWALRGRSSFSGGSWNVASGSGGFRATLATNGPGDAADDAISWQIDGVVAG